MGQVAGFGGKMTDNDGMDIKITDKVDEIKASYQKDSLTGLWKQAYFAGRVDTIINIERSFGTLYIIDINGFSKINEEKGYIIGDACLSEFAKALKESFKEADIHARISVDEFGAFATGRLSDSGIADIARKLINVSREKFKALGLGDELSLSIGIAKSPENGCDFLTIYKKAIEELAKAKENGMNYHIATDPVISELSVKANADMKIVKSLVLDLNKVSGALNVEYEGFKQILQFISRYSSRQKTDVSIILFTLTKKDGEMVEPVILTDAMFDLENIIKSSLRIGDVATKYSSCQYLVMLIGAKNSEPEMIAGRILDNFKPFTDKYEISMKYDTDYIVVKES